MPSPWNSRTRPSSSSMAWAPAFRYNAKMLRTISGSVTSVRSVNFTMSAKTRLTNARWPSTTDCPDQGPTASISTARRLSGSAASTSSANPATWSHAPIEAAASIDCSRRSIEEFQAVLRQVGPAPVAPHLPNAS